MAALPVRAVGDLLTSISPFAASGPMGHGDRGSRCWQARTTAAGARGRACLAELDDTIGFRLVEDDIVTDHCSRLV